MTIEGRAFPVDIFYVKQPVADYLMATVKTVLAIHREEGPGDVLAFLTGQEEVEKTVAELRYMCRILYRIFFFCQWGEIVVCGNILQVM